MLPYVEILVVLLFLGSGISLIVLSLLVYRRNHNTLSRTFLFLMVFCSVWVFFHLLELVFSSALGTLMWGRLKYVGMVIVPVAWLNFALQYTGRERYVSWRNTALLLVVPTVVLFALWTNGYHNLFYGEVVIRELEGLTYFSATFGPFFWFNAVYIYLLVIAGIAMVLHALSSLHRQYWKQGLVIAVGVLTPLLGNILYVSTTDPGLDITPLLFLPASISLVFGIRNFNFLDALLIGRDTVFEKTSNSILVLDRDGKIIDLNKAGEKLVKDIISGDNNVIGKRAKDIFSGKFSFTDPPNTKEETRREFELEKNGDKRYFEAQIDPIRESRENQVGWILTIRDITERKEAEKELKQYAEGVNAADDSIYMIDRDHRYVLANDEHLSRLVEDGRISRKKEDELVGRKYREVHPESDSKSLEEKVTKVMETGEPLKVEHEFSSVDRWSSRTYSPVKDPETGEVEVVVVVSKDITERKKAEEREEFLHSLLRHDVRNKAQIVAGYLELLKDTALSKEQEELVIKALKATEEGSDLIEKVRTLRNVKTKKDVKEVEAEPFLEEAIDQNRGRASEKGIDIECEDCECRVMGGFLLEELFSNLLENAIVHSDCDEIRVSSEETDDECIITVEDNGCGVSEEDKEKIFDKGFKTGETAGSGLGTYLVKEIAESYGGSIEVKNSELGGARFEIYLQKA